MGKPGERIVVYASTRNQYDKMETAAKSLLLNNVIDKVYFLTEDEEYPNELPSCIETINVEPIIEDYFNKNGPNFNSEWSYMTLLRLILYDILPNHDKVLYLDTDTLAIKSMTELFDIDLAGYYCAGVVEEAVGWGEVQVIRAIGSEPYRIMPRLPYNFGNYFNVGVLLFNLKALRDGTGKDIIRLINTEPLMLKDQDAINIICRNKILRLPSDYNAAPMTAATANPKIIHLSKVENQYYETVWNTYKAIPWPWIERQIEINRRKEEEAKQ